MEKANEYSIDKNGKYHGEAKFYYDVVLFGHGMYKHGYRDGWWFMATLKGDNPTFVLFNDGEAICRMKVKSFK